MNIIDQVKTIISNLSGAENVQLDDTLGDTLAMDNLSMVTLLVELEDSFQITFLESDLNPFELKTVADVVALVKKYEEETNG